jgi:acyl carrier protein
MSTAETIRRYIADNFLFDAQTKLADDASLIGAGIIDSTGVMELVSFLENEFGVEVDDRDLVPENLDSVNALTAFVARNLAPVPSANAA